MDLKINRNYHGFLLTEERKVKEINSISRIFKHEKSGAELIHLANNDENKVFAITFRTPPSDGTGIPHILEHSVLYGSRKFPVKEPFVELAKGSLKTFLNAMTYPDKTMYPIASTNDKDFFNLMDVYLDAVLYPNIYKHPEIFRQEGWHYQLDDPESEITYSGVVYNEMLGVFSSPEQTLFRIIQKSLFPENVYSNEAGGDPAFIPDLTYKEFIAYHKKYYHPSNCKIFLYGNGDLLEQLQFLNDNYLKDFSANRVDSEILWHEPFSKLKEVVDQYSISPDEDEKNKTYLSLNFVAGKADEPETLLALEILEPVLLETPAAPLKKALIDAGLGKDVFGSYSVNLRQPIFSIVMKNSEKDRKEKFLKVVYDTLENLSRNGIDKKLIEAVINSTEFKLREADFGSLPNGLVYCDLIMNSWIYEGHPTIHLEYEPVLEKIKSALTTNYFEKLIDEYLLKNTHCSLVILSPQKGLSDDNITNIKEKLKNYKSHISIQETNQLIEETKKLKLRQAQPDAPEDLEKIPMLSLGDIKRDAEFLPLVEMEESGIKLLSHPIFTSGIAYVNLYFDSTTIVKEDLPYISLLSRLLGDISTEKQHYSDLSNEINIHTGGIDFSVECYTENSNNRIYYPKFTVQSKALIGKLPKLFELLGEIIGETKFDDVKRIREIVQETKSRMEMKIAQAGHMVASSRLVSYFSPSGKYGEYTGGLTYYKFIADLEKNFDKQFEEVSQILSRIKKSVFNRNNLLVSLTQREEDYLHFQKPFVQFFSTLDSENLERFDYHFEFSQGNEGLLTPAMVQYVVKGFNFRQLDYKYSGSMQVFGNIVNLDYLWNRIRIQGGAYGAFAQFNRNGDMFLGTFRDPNLKETIDVFNEMADYFRNFNLSNREMTKYIIGTIAQLDTPLTPSMKGNIAAARYISHVNHEDIQKNRDEVLSTTPKQIRQFADMIEAAMKKNYLCVLGNEKIILDNKQIFNNLVNVFE